MHNGILPPNSSFSYVHDPKGMPIITQLYNLIGKPYVHLLPLVPVLFGGFYLISMPFTKKIIFNANDGASEKTILATKGDEIILPSDGFRKQGHILIGWTDSDDEKLKYSAGERFIVKDKIKFYAVYKKAEK